MNLTEEIIEAMGFERQDVFRCKWGPEKEWAYTAYGKPYMRISTGGPIYGEGFHTDSVSGRLTLPLLTKALLDYCRDMTRRETKALVMQNLEKTLFEVKDAET